MAQPVLTIEGVCPGELRAEVRGASPGAVVQLYFSPQRGYYVFPIFHPCEGIEVGLDVRHVRFVMSTRADESGVALLQAMAGRPACGGYVQSYTDFCRVSNVAQIP